MAHEIVVPRLGWSMDEGTFVQWLRQDGDAVEPGQSLFVLESEKAAQEIESLDRGILRIPRGGPQPGETVAVGQVLGFLVAEGEAAPPIGPVKNEGPRSNREPPAQASQAALEVGGSKPDDRRPAGLAAAEGVGAVSTKSSPRARRAARRADVDWRLVTGTGRGGRVRERDILAVAGEPRPTSSNDVAADGRLMPVSAIRRTIAARMVAGTHEAAPVTLTTTADATNLVRFRTRLHENGSAENVPTYTDLVVKSVAAALENHPQLTAQWREDGIFIPHGIHISVAVDTEAGLLAPVLRDANRLTLPEIARQMRTLIDLARGGRLTAEQMQAAVFTVTNLGMYGIDAFTPIINLPQSAVLGIGRIRSVPAIVDGAVVPRETIALSLTFDHRVTDGAPAARFLQAIVRSIEQFEHGHL